MRYTAEWLIAHGYDGLYDTCPDNDECGCTVSELRPCDKNWRVGRKCRPGHKLSDGGLTLIGRRCTDVSSLFYPLTQADRISLSESMLEHDRELHGRRDDNG